MLLDRAGLVTGLAGIVAMLACRTMTPPAARNTAPRAPAPKAFEPYVARCNTYVEPMTGPYESLQATCADCVFDGRTLRGQPPFEELTVLHGGEREYPDLTNHHTVQLAVRVGGHWFVRHLGSEGPFCGGMGTPTWTTVTAGAPRVYTPDPNYPSTEGFAPGVTIAVDVDHSATRSEQTRTWSERIVCGVGPSGFPGCTHLDDKATCGDHSGFAFP